MIVIFIGASKDNILVVKLLHANMIVDPRHMGGLRGDEFSVSVNGRTLTITRIHDGEDEGWWREFSLRAYMPTDVIPDFTSTICTYWGLDGEDVPKDTTEVIFHPSATTIQECAFYGCESLVRVTIPDTVTRIEDNAFNGCDFLRSIQLSRNLVFIGRQAFLDCSSLEAVFLPPTVTRIGYGAFAYCRSLRFFNLPEEIEHLGYEVVDGCHRLLTTVEYEKDDYGGILNSEEVNQWLIHRHAHLPFHQACFTTSINPQGIAVCFEEHGIELATEIDHQHMTALHILCANPHVTGDCIRAYLTLASEAANVQDSTGMTGLHILCSLPHQDTCTGDAIRTYLNLAPEAANVQDSKGMAPFQYLCESDVTFLDDGNFSSVMIWWYHCMPPQTETG